MKNKCCRVVLKRPSLLNLKAGYCSVIVARLMARPIGRENLKAFLPNWELHSKKNSIAMMP